MWIDREQFRAMVERISHLETVNAELISYIAYKRLPDFITAERRTENPDPAKSVHQRPDPVEAAYEKARQALDDGKG